MAPNPIDTYLQEADDLLEEIELTALSLTSEEHSGEGIDLLFRAFHTIKGSGAMCGLDDVAGFTHHIESVLSMVRDGELIVSESLVSLMLKAKDQIRLLLAAEQGGAAVPAGSNERLIAEMGRFAEQAPTGPSAPETRRRGPGGWDGVSPEKAWSIEFRPNPRLFAMGGNPIALLKDLAGLGRCVVEAHTEELPELESMQPDRCYLWWSIRLTGAVDENAIRDVFIFVEEESQLAITCAGAPALPMDEKAVQVASRACAVRGNDNTVTAPEGAGSPQKTLAREATVRVPSSRLDQLVNLVGELVMNQSRLAEAAAHHKSPEFDAPVQELERLVAELRHNVLGIRMLPIGTLFGRFRRLVHDLSSELGKEAELVTEGAETELDKSILDQLGEPLVHCLRNCLDHGAEPPTEREALGKPRRVSVHLSATHVGSNVVVSVQDDGRGVNVAAVRAKAVEKQIIAADASLSDKEILGLILLPGFSTARQLTNVSGRGVGLDVVKRQIDALRGSLSLTSEPGKGTRIGITLPLTLAIIEGLLIQIGDDQFIVPMAAVNENVELQRWQRRRNNKRNVIDVRGELVPYVDLRDLFHIGGERPSIEKVVIVQCEDHRVGLVVDGVLGTHQTVIQSLGTYYRGIETVSGATIMGDGRVALILDIAATVRLADRSWRRYAMGVNAGATEADLEPGLESRLCRSN